MVSVLVRGFKEDHGSLAQQNSLVQNGVDCMRQCVQSLLEHVHNVDERNDGARYGVDRMRYDEVQRGTFEDVHSLWQDVDAEGERPHVFRAGAAERPQHVGGTAPVCLLGYGRFS